MLRNAATKLVSKGNLTLKLMKCILVEFQGDGTRHSADKVPVLWPQLRSIQNAARSLVVVLRRFEMIGKNWNWKLNFSIHLTLNI